MFSEGEWEVGCGRSRAFLFDKNRFNPLISEKVCFIALDSAFFAVSQREKACFIQRRIGSTQLFAASVSLPICSSSDFFSLINSACLVR